MKVSRENQSFNQPEEEQSGCMMGCFALVLAILAVFVVGAGVCTMEVVISHGLTYMVNQYQSFLFRIIWFVLNLVGVVAMCVVPIWAGMNVHRMVLGKSPDSSDSSASKSSHHSGYRILRQRDEDDE